MLAKSFDFGRRWNIIQASECNGNLWTVVKFANSYPMIFRYRSQAGCTSVGLVVDRFGNIWKPWE